MSNRDLLRIVVANLRRMRARVSLTAIGVIVGTAAVVLLISLSVGLQQNLTSSLGEFGDLTLITVSPGGGQRERGSDVRLDGKALAAFAALPDVVVVTPRMSPQGMVTLKIGRSETGAWIQGIDAGAADEMGWELASGQARLGRGQVVVGPKVFEGMDFVMIGAAGVMMPGAGGAAGAAPKELQGRTLTAVLTRYGDDGQEVTRSERLHVAGVFAETGGMNDRAVYVGRGDVEAWDQWFSGRRRSARDEYSEVIVKVAAPEQVRAVQAAIDDLGYNSYSNQQIADEIGQMFLIVRAVLGGVGGIALLVAAFGIANTMTMAIYERTKEIGVMKAVGATNRDVLRIFLAEASAIGALGGVFGVVLGWGGGIGINFALQQIVRQSAAAAMSPDQSSDPILVTPVWLMLFALGFATVVGLLSGIYPALRAASMKPLRALRTE